MMKHKYWLSALLMFSFLVGMQAQEECLKPKAQIDQGVNRLTQGKVNNVRARLRTGGDNWWDGSGDGKYVVPAVAAGEIEVSSVFAGGVWLGGFDSGGNLKLAAQTYGSSQGNTDFYNGPLNDSDGTTEKERCEDWDRFFEVYASEIDDHIALLAEATNGGTYEQDQIPFGVKYWPGKGNQYFASYYGFALPDNEQGLAYFYDADADGSYEPLNGDYPVIRVRGCEEPQYPDQMIYWIYNDNGGIHSETQGDAIQMEIQVQSFAYGTNDQVNDMTFQAYRLINRAIDEIDSTYFAMWADIDLGCYTDDYIGCDTVRSLGYAYNADEEDGTNGITCLQGVPTYGNEVPMIGIDYFRGPLKPMFDTDDNIIGEEELGMSSFAVYNNGGVGDPPVGTTDPSQDFEYYNYLSGSWRDGTPIQFGGDGYQTGGEEVDYVFFDEPNNGDGWSMCTETLPSDYDRRQLQASGPFRLLPGAVNELIVGVVWVPDMTYPCPDLNRFFKADDFAQGLFDSCFDILDGPDAPDVDLVELDKELVMILTNDKLTSNNAFEAYTEDDPTAPVIIGIDPAYKFEGYLVYQIPSPNDVADLQDPEKARLILQMDVKNGISTIYNWSSESIAYPDGTTDEVWFPTVQVEGSNKGIEHTFKVTNDAFKSGNDTRLINHTRYYYKVVAYGYNNYEEFNEDLGEGQRRPFIIGRRGGSPFTAIPRPIVDQTLNSNYGDGAIVTRLDGVGVGSNFLDISDESRDQILNGEFDGSITYKEGGGPIAVKIFNPLEVTNGSYELRFKDSDQNDDALDVDAVWELEDLGTGEIIASETSIELLNEQVFGQYGFSIAIQNDEDLFNSASPDGAVGSEVVYSDVTGADWFDVVKDEEDFGIQASFISSTFDYVNPEEGSNVFNIDPNNTLGSMADGFVPFPLATNDYTTDPTNPAAGPVLTPGWTKVGASTFFNNNFNLPQIMGNLNNIDIVFTSDKSMWSRCIVVETANPGMTSNFPSIENHAQMMLRGSTSVGKYDSDGDGKADTDTSDAPTGKGWFPGYAINVETGKRVNIFFGENSSFSQSPLKEFFPDEDSKTDDMMFNPSDETLLEFQGVQFGQANLYCGGQHFIYVTNTEYDGCNALYDAAKNLTPNSAYTFYLTYIRNVVWAGFPILKSGASLDPLGSGESGLIPNDVTVKLRVTSPYAVETGTGVRNGNPTYQFDIAGKESTDLTSDEVESALDMINVVPNPYYGFSNYDSNNFNNTIKITNLPATCVVSIYSLDGKFIKRFNRAERYTTPSGTNRGLQSAQYAPDVEWDMKNSQNIPVAGGVYLIHVEAEGLGERVIKWFGTNRQFDATGL
jgi:hypothetical protein